MFMYLIKNIFEFDSDKEEEEFAKKYKRVRNYAILGLASVFLAFNTIGVIKPGEIGIIVRAGKVDRVIDSGLMFKIPLIEKKIIMNTRIQKESVLSSAVTQDLQDVNAELVLNYSIDKESALELYKNVGTEYKDNIIIPVLHESFKAGSAKYSAEGIISDRSKAKQEILDVVKDRLDDYGILVSDLNIVNLEFSEAFNQAIEEKAIAQQQVEKAKQDLEKAKVEAERKVTEAQAEAEAQRLQQSTLTDLMIKKMYIEKWNGQLPTTTTGNSDMMINLK